MEIGFRISAENMTGREFDRLISDLREMGATTEQVDRSARVFGSRLADVRTELGSVAIAADVSVTSLDLVGRSFDQVGIEMEGTRDGLTVLEGSAGDAETRIASLQEVIRESSVGYEDVVETAEQLKVLEGVTQSVVSEFQRFEDVVTRAIRESGVLVRNFVIEIVGLNSALSGTEDVFNSVGNGAELDTATQRLVHALDAVTRVSREGIETQIAVEGAALSRLSNQERAELEHAEKVRELAIGLHQLEVDFEGEKTRISGEEVEKRTEFYERASELRMEAARGTAEVEAQLNRNTARDLQLLVGVVSEYGQTQRQRFLDIVNTYRDHGRLMESAIEGAQNFIGITEVMGTALERTGAATIAFSAVLRRDLFEGLRTGVGYFDDFTRGVRDARLATLESEVALIETIARLEDGQAARDQRTQDIFGAGAARFRENEQGAISQGRAFVSELRREQPFSVDVLSEGAGDLVSAVPVDVVEAIKQSVELRRDANSEILQLEQEAAAEIQLYQESVTLSAENKAKAIERIERQTALQRIQIENEVSQRQRDSFQSVVTNFISGIGEMIIAEGQLALARRATNAIGTLFGGGTAAGAAASGGVGLLGGVLAPLLIGGAIVYGASSLISRSSRSADVYERSEIGSVRTPGEGGVFRGSQRQGETRASLESETPTLEANINVNVEASGTRLGQANERVRLKTERWGG